MNPNQGRTFVRAAKALALSRGNPVGAVAFLEGQNFTDKQQAIQVLMAAVTPQGTSDMALPTPAEFDFAEFLRPLTVVGKLAGLRRVPSRVRSIAATAGSTAFWSGERNPRPISRMTLTGETLEPLSLIAMLVATKELLASSSPSAENILGRDLAAAVAQAMDEAFLDPTNAGTAGVKPAAITNGANIVHSSGGTLAQVDADLQLLVQALSDAGSNLVFATWILRPRTAIYLAGLRGSDGAPAFPQMGVKGGILLGLPAITSAASLSDIGSPAEGGEITLVDPSQILLADDGGSKIEASEQGALQMSDAPSAPSTLVSLWQTHSAVLKVTRYANWKRVRAGVVQVLDQVNY